MTGRPRLTTTRTVLVPQSLDAARALLAGEDPGLPLADGYPHADSLDAMRMYVEHGGPDDGGWFVTLADDGRVVGDCGTFGPPDDEGRVEVGYGLAAPFRGRGLGTEAVGALVAFRATYFLLPLPLGGMLLLISELLRRSRRSGFAGAAEQSR